MGFLPDDHTGRYFVCSGGRPFSCISAAAARGTPGGTVAFNRPGQVAGGFPQDPSPTSSFVMLPGL